MCRRTEEEVVLQHKIKFYSLLVKLPGSNKSESKTIILMKSMGEKQGYAKVAGLYEICENTGKSTILMKSMGEKQGYAKVAGLYEICENTGKSTKTYQNDI